MSDAVEPRPLGSDQLFWWLADRHHPVHVALVAEIAGPTTIADWRSALRALQRRHPNLSGKIVEGSDARLWFHHVADAPIPLRVVDADPSSWDLELARELMTGFDLRQAPLARAALVHRRDRSTLILSMHHAIADAKSILFAIRDLLVALSGQPIAPLPPMPSLTSLLFKDGRPSEIDTPDNEALLPDSTGPDASHSFAGQIPGIARLSLTPALTTELRQRARAERTTVHCALVTAAAVAARQISTELADAPITMISPSDMRSLLGAGEDVAPLAGGATLTMAPGKDTGSFWHTARAVQEGLAPPRTLAQLAEAFAPIERLMARRPSLQEATAFYLRNREQRISINNLGLAPFDPKIGALSLQALWGPAILLGYEGERLISAITVNGSLNLLHVSYKPLPRVLEVMQQHLARACEPVQDPT